MSLSTLALLAGTNVLLIFLLLAAPLGVRTVRLSARIGSDRERIWSAIFPLGNNALWSGQFVGVTPLERREAGHAGSSAPLRARVKLGWAGRDGEPIERTMVFDECVPMQRFVARIEDDSSLDLAFWSTYREEVVLSDAPDHTELVMCQTDRYRGAAFLIFRYFAMRREMSRLKSWAETGRFRRTGRFEHPLTQLGMAVLSAVLLWPLFGLTIGGLILATILTLVVALHELGHMAAFRVAGHKAVRMIFLPLLGGIALGGRPYDSRFEVAFVALMGAGFSAFLVPIAVAASVLSRHEQPHISALFAVLAGCTALFNIANLVPVWKFDGGQVLRQICPNRLSLSLASFATLGAFLGLASAVGFPRSIVLAAGVVFAVLSLITAESGVRLKGELKPLRRCERPALALAFVAVFVVHAVGVIWAAGRLA